MKVVILGAGKGERFENYEGPKSQILLSNEKSILELQLENLSQYVHLDHVIVVVGYLQELIREKHPNLNYLENLHYETTNTAKSLLIALDHIEEEDVLWLNGDVVFHPYVLHRLISFGKSGMVVNEQPVGNEEIKYRTDGIGRILFISKEVEDARGEAVGINFFKAEDVGSLKRSLVRCSPNDYFERGVQDCIEEGVEVWAVPVKNSAAVEIDFPDDLEKANMLIDRWSQNLI